jgi:hypothetical protein
VRYDVNPAPVDAAGANPYTLTSNDVSSARIAPRGTPLWNTKFSNFAPRLGLAYIVHTTPGWETTFRIGGGLFYDTGNSVASRGYNGGGISNLTILQNTRFPVTQAPFDAVPQPNINPPYNVGYITYDPNLRVPRSAQWNVAIEQTLGPQQTFKLSYVGSAGRQLTRARFLYPRALGNQNFTANTAITHTTNGVSSNYSAMQVEWQRRMHHGLQVLAAYTWSHSMDGTSTNFNTYSLLRADSDFDIRNNFQAAVTYEVPNSFQNRYAYAVLGHWARTFASIHAVHYQLMSSVVSRSTRLRANICTTTQAVFRISRSISAHQTRQALCLRVDAASMRLPSLTQPA